ncbi:hypothetical protein CEXT_153511 [Caerostris extrusa]|uniref:Uncharacterized protein n=1 Tax=Caerostris extrusa TaxID=172846 RepID=A0AAV4WX25_CAEEX|nr:hypothetical protein CEXT_153511 [Caerostris extrusa]
MTYLHAYRRTHRSSWGPPSGLSGGFGAPANQLKDIKETKAGSRIGGRTYNRGLEQFSSNKPHNKQANNFQSTVYIIYMYICIPVYMLPSLYRNSNAVVFLDSILQDSISPTPELRRDNQSSFIHWAITNKHITSNKTNPAWVQPAKGPPIKLSLAHLNKGRRYFGDDT